jgi:hypothetical protein
MYRVVLNDGLRWDLSLPPAPLSICTDCSATSCVPIPYVQTTTLAISDQAVVHFQNVVAPAVESKALSMLEFRPN